MFGGYNINLSNGRGNKTSSESLCFTGGKAVSVARWKELKFFIELVGAILQSSCYPLQLSGVQGSGTKLWLSNQPARPLNYLVGEFLFLRDKLLHQHTKQKDKINSIKAR